MRLSKGCQQTCLESIFEHEGGNGEEGRMSLSEAGYCSVGISGQDALSIRTS